MMIRLMTVRAINSGMGAILILIDKVTFFTYIYHLNNLNQVQLFDKITSLMPLLICALAIILLSARYLQLTKLHHLYLLFAFILLGFSYLYTYLFCSKEYQAIAWLFPLRQPVKFLLIPLSYLYMISAFLGKRNTYGSILIHFVPAIFIFVGFIPFWFVSPDIQLNYVAHDYTNETNNFVIQNIQILRIVSVFGVFNLMLLIYAWMSVLEFRKYQKTHTVSLFSKSGSETLSITLVFFTLLLVLVDNAYFLGISQMANSRILFNVMSSLILVLVFFNGFNRKKCIVCEKQASLSEDNSPDEDS